MILDNGSLIYKGTVIDKAGEANLRRSSTDMLWRGIEINVWEGLSSFKLDWIWWSVPSSKQFGAQSIVEFTDVTRLLGLQIEWRNNVFLTVRFKCVVLFIPIWSNCWRLYFTTVSFTAYAVCTDLSEDSDKSGISEAPIGTVTVVIGTVPTPL